MTGHWVLPAGVSLTKSLSTIQARIAGGSVCDAAPDSRTIAHLSGTWM